MANRISLSKGLATLFFIPSCLIFLTYRSFVRQVFYVNWYAGLFLFLFWLLITASTWRISKITSKTFILSSCWICFAFLLTAFATHPLHHLKVLAVTFFYTVASVIIVDLFFKTKCRIDTVAFFLLIIWTTVNLIILFLFLMDKLSFMRNFSGVFHDRNVFSMTSLYICAFFIGAFKDSSGLRNFVGASCVFMNFLMIILSLSMTGLLGIVYFIIYFLFSADISWKVKIPAYFFTALAFFIVFCMPNPLINRAYRFYYALSGQSDMLYENESAFIRPFLLKVGIEAAKEHWLTGIGIDNVRFHYTWPARSTGSFLHNTYLDILTSGGVLLFILYYAPIILSIVRLKIIKKRDCAAMGRGFKNQMLTVCFHFLYLKLLFDLTWTTYFEFGMILPMIFAFYVFICLSSAHRKEMGFFDSHSLFG
jgi:O-antigen ligase